MTPKYPHDMLQQGRLYTLWSQCRITTSARGRHAVRTWFKWPSKDYAKCSHEKHMVATWYIESYHMITRWSPLDNHVVCQGSEIFRDLLGDPNTACITLLATFRVTLLRLRFICKLDFFDSCSSRSIVRNASRMSMLPSAADTSKKWHPYSSARSRPSSGLTSRLCSRSTMLATMAIGTEHGDLQRCR